MFCERIFPTPLTAGLAMFPVKGNRICTKVVYLSTAEPVKDIARFRHCFTSAVRSLCLERVHAFLLGPGMNKMRIREAVDPQRASSTSKKEPCVVEIH